MAFWCNGKKGLCFNKDMCKERRCIFFNGDGGHNVEIATTADRIRSMSDEEMAVWLVKQTAYRESTWSETTYLNFLTGQDDTRENAMADTLKWLQKPAEGVE